MAPGTLIPSYVMHDGKRWRVESVEPWDDGEQWYRLTLPVPGKAPRKLFARASDCSPWVRPQRRTIKGARRDAVRLRLGRLRLDMTLGALVDLVLAARGRNKARDRALKRGRRAPV